MRYFVFFVAALLVDFFVFLLQHVIADWVALYVVLHKCAGQYGLFGQVDLLHNVRLFAQALFDRGLRKHFDVDQFIAHCIAQFRGVRLALCHGCFYAHIETRLGNGYAVNGCGSFCFCINTAAHDRTQQGQCSKL